jgi:trans-aconitate methyltransferase
LYRRHGDDPRSLSHNDPVTQRERFQRIARCFDDMEDGFTVHEIGCGLGHFGQFLAERYPGALYSGSEICEEFAEHCRRLFPDGSFHVRDISSKLPDDR